jgi:hypothetical protein
VLLSVLLGVGFYAGYVSTGHEFDKITEQLKQLLAGSLSHQHE